MNEMLYSPTIFSTVLSLTAAEGGRLPTTHGKLLHAAFMDALRQVSPEPAATLHASDERSPFTLSPLQGVGHGRKGRINIRKGQEATLRIAMSDSQLLEDFTTFFMRGHTSLRLGNLNFMVSDIYTASRHHKWVRATSPQELYARWEGEPVAEEHSEIRLVFKTPTAFSSHDHRNYVLPDPAMVFGALANYWDGLADAETEEAVRAYAGEHLVIAYHRIKTHVYYYDVPQVGFAGQVRFKILDTENKAMFRHLNRLADLVFFTGLGTKTGMGMGQVMREAWW